MNKDAGHILWSVARLSPPNYNAAFVKVAPLSGEENDETTDERERPADMPIILPMSLFHG